MILSPILFKERLTRPKITGFLIVLVGIVLVNGKMAAGHGKAAGLFCGAMSAVMYFFIVTLNKKSEKITGMENALVQLTVSFLTVALFVGVKQGFVIHVPAEAWPWILVLGIVNTGIGCYLYFSPLSKLPVQTVLWLAVSGAVMGVNWILLFEAYNYTTVAVATLCYYMQPVFYILAGAIVLKERLTAKKLACVAVAFCGMILVSGVLQTGLHISELKGVIFGVSGGFFYAMVVLINKYMKDISPVNTTIMQMALVSVIMLPYSAATGAFGGVSVTAAGIICLLILGILHTGVGYIIYFDAVNKLPTQTVGILSYIDPVEAVLLSAFFLREPINIYTVIGAVLILGAAAVSELTGSGETAR